MTFVAVDLDFIFPTKWPNLQNHRFFVVASLITDYLVIQFSAFRFISKSLSRFFALLICLCKCLQWVGSSSS